jgi:hypothetical protein
MDRDSKLPVAELEQTRIRWLRPRLSLLPFITAALFAIFILTMAKLVWAVPKPFLLSLGSIFIFWSIVYWGMKFKDKTSGSVNQFLKRMAILLFGWAIISVITLGAAYGIDRSGWLWLKLTGYYTVPSEDYSVQVNLSADDFVREHPAFVLDPQNPKDLILPAGDFVFKETVVTPRGYKLIIEPGAHLRFGAGRSLISYSPIIAQGTEEQPISFTSLHPWYKWGVIGVVNAQGSVFEYVHFEDGREAIVNDIDFLGGLTLLESDAQIRHGTFEHMSGKDAVHVYRGYVLIRDSLFQDTYKDCLDLDGGKGEISLNQFLNCGDEGIDLSENYEVAVFENLVLGPKGGRISADNNLEEIISLNTLGVSGGK